MKINIGNKEIDFQVNEQTQEIFCTSLDVARVFNKNHQHILRDIDKIVKDIRRLGHLKQLSNFGQLFYKQKLGQGAMRNNRVYNLTRDGFSLVAMGFTGEKALDWKLSFIDAFNFMERELRTLKENAQASLERPKEVFNLIYETPCRDAVLDVVKQMEKENQAKAKRIREYKITEELKKGKITTSVDVGVDWHTPSLFSPKEVESLHTGKAKRIRG